ncbi:MAG: ATP-binding protein [Oscillospiraceae bacterium]|jgi:hypothetical protein|nr:ATP-binding protein [Oscillospiraceae bacterium]
MAMEPNLREAALLRVRSREDARRRAAEERRAALRERHPDLKEAEDALLRLQFDSLLGTASAGEIEAMSARRAELAERYGADKVSAVPEDAPDLAGEYALLQVRALRGYVDTDTMCFARFDESLCEPEVKGCKRFCEKYAAEFCPGAGNLLFSGGTGTGKTFMSVCVLGEAAKRGFWTEYATAADFFHAADAHQFGRDAPDGRDFERFARCDLLALDDLGTEFITAPAQTALYELVNTRLLAGVSTIVTTNLTHDQMRERYLPQVASRLFGEYELFYFPGRDLRLR